MSFRSRADNWGPDFEAARRLGSDIAKDLADRGAAMRAGRSGKEEAAGIRRKLHKLSGDLNTLRSSLSSNTKLTRQESARRRDELTRLDTRRQNMERSLREGPSSSRKNDLMAGPSGAVRKWGEPETAATADLDNQGLLQLQKDIITTQDSQLDEISAVLKRQKQIGIAINQELEEQTHLLSDVERDVDGVDHRLKKENKRLDKLSRKSKNCGALCCVVILVAILVVLALTDWGCDIVHSKSYCAAH